MPDYIAELDPRASEAVRQAVKYLLLDYIASSASMLFVACVNLAIANGVSLGIDEMRAALKAGDKSYDQPPT